MESGLKTEEIVQSGFGEVLRMNLQQLKYVIAVAEAKSITKAAEAVLL